MHKIMMALTILSIISLFVPSVSLASLTEKQQNNIVLFARDFVKEGNEAGLLQYGAVHIYHTYQMRLTYADTNYVTHNNKRVKILFMMNPDGYPDEAAYHAELRNETGGYLDPGDYLVLDCSAFVAYLYKHVFGLRFDYVNSNHLSVWTTKMYFSIPTVTTYDGLGTVPLFEQIYDRTEDSLFAVSDIPTVGLEAGDMIVGYNEKTDQHLGHIMMYTGNGHLIHSSSTPLTNTDGSISPLLMREQPVHTLTNKSYTKMRVYRISTGVLNPAFDGYMNRINFAALNTDKGIFDTQPPHIEDITVSDHTGRKLITVTASDEYGNDDVIRLASDPNVVMRSSGFGESGVLGVFISTSPEPPADMYEGWSSVKGNRFELYRSTGTYYIWVKDAADNLSKPWKVMIRKDVAVVTHSEHHRGVTMLAHTGVQPDSNHVILVSRDGGASWEGYLGQITIEEEGTHPIRLKVFDEMTHEFTELRVDIQVESAAPLKC